MDNHEKHEMLKYMGIALAALIGAFLAFYFIADLTMHRLLSPAYQMRKMEKMMNKDFARAEKADDFMINKEIRFQHDLNRFAAIQKDGNAYKIIVDLKMVGNDPKNVEINAEDDDMAINIEGAVEKKHRRGEQLTKFSETFMIDEKININKMTSERHGDRMIYIIPFMK